jgi:hypothetical protein
MINVNDKKAYDYMRFIFLAEMEVRSNGVKSLGGANGTMDELTALLVEDFWACGGTQEVIEEVQDIAIERAKAAFASKEVDWKDVTRDFSRLVSAGHR